MASEASARCSWENEWQRAHANGAIRAVSTIASTKVSDTRGHYVGASCMLQDTKPLQQFLSTSTLVRYLRARSWQLQRASKMLLATLKWYGGRLTPTAEPAGDFSCLPVITSQ